MPWPMVDIMSIIDYIDLFFTILVSLVYMTTMLVLYGAGHLYTPIRLKVAKFFVKKKIVCFENKLHHWIPYASKPQNPRLFGLKANFCPLLKFFLPFFAHFPGTHYFMIAQGRVNRYAHIMTFVKVCIHIPPCPVAGA